MELATIVLIGLGLSMISLANSATSGFSIKISHIDKVLKISVTTAFIQAFIPFLGWLLGKGLQMYSQEYHTFIVSALLLAAAFKMLWEGYSKKNIIAKYFKPLDSIRLLDMGLSYSAHALLIGICFGLMDADIIFSFVIFFAIAFFASIAGVFLGAMQQEKRIIRSEIIGGLIILSIGIKIANSALMAV